MAIWQYDLYLLPRSKIIEQCSTLPPVMSREGFDSIRWWSSIQLRQNYQQLLDSFLPRFVSWNKKTLCWGSAEGNLVEVRQNGGEVEEIFVRIDARRDIEDIVKNIIRFAGQNDCLLLLTETMELIQPDREVLMRKINMSRAMQCATNPKRYFDNISDA